MRRTIAWSRSLGGLPIDPEVAEVLEAQRAVLAELACDVIDGEPGLDDAEATFFTWRAWSFAAELGALLDAHPELIGENVRWNIEQRRLLSGADLAAAEQSHAALYHRMREFMDRYDFLVCPVTQCRRFPTPTDHP